MIIVDPYSYHFAGGKLLAPPPPDSDGRNAPIYDSLRNLARRGFAVHTSDYLFSSGAQAAGPIDYYSIGMLNHRALKDRADIRFRAFVVHEPPVIAPRLYKILPELTSTFEEVYVHNTEGVGYSLKGVNQARLKKLYHPIPYGRVLDQYWHARDRLNKMVVINSLQNPWLFRIVDITSFKSPRDFKFNSIFEMLSPSFTGPEHYSMRLEAIAALADERAIDLYGRKWNLKLSPEVVWPSFLKLRRKLLSVYHGACHSKYEVLSRYAFSLVIENSSMKGCVSEKIFDCFYAGTIPLYFGPPDIARFVPREAFIDVREFSGWADLWAHVKALPEKEREAMREAAREFLARDGAAPFVHFYDQVFRSRES